MKKLLFTLFLSITGLVHSQTVDLNTNRIVIAGDTIQSTEYSNIFKINLTDEILVYTLFYESDLLESKKIKISDIEFDFGITKFSTLDDTEYVLVIYNRTCYLDSGDVIWIGECEVDFSRIR